MPRYASEERRREDEARHHRDIVEAAVRVFAARGFHATTMEDVAREARFSVGKIYLHFPSKRSLYEEILDGYASRLVEVAERLLDSKGSPVERIERYVRGVLDFLDEHPLFLRLAVREAIGIEIRASDFGEGYTKKAERLLTRTQRTFEEGLRLGDFAGATALELTRKLTGIMYVFVVNEARGPNPPPNASLAERILALFFESPLPGRRFAPSRRKTAAAKSRRR